MQVTLLIIWGYPFLTAKKDIHKPFEKMQNLLQSMKLPSNFNFEGMNKQNIIKLVFHIILIYPPAHSS
jgi:hypothetical protein